MEYVPSASGWMRRILPTSEFVFPMYVEHQKLQQVAFINRIVAIRKKWIGVIAQPNGSISVTVKLQSAASDNILCVEREWQARLFRRIYRACCL